ncbi:ABC-F family ATP-binding cassette domain-containing protein [Amycolatopsis sp. cg5]|uniref:ABC-F family ATP-binding cassette domain-containing protein n=1 Tax=Amycolatopsis sp. cg5 TaxID=3238802 RepID=UPI0035262EF6
MSFSLHARDLVFSYGDRVVFDGVSLKAGAGQRLGLVGENGIGKSTLLRLLAGVEEPHGGSVELGGDLGFLLQELPFDQADTFADVIDDALAEIRVQARRLDELAERMASEYTAAHSASVEGGGGRRAGESAVPEYGRVLDWAQTHELWDADRRAEIVCAGLGLAGISPARPLGTLSGGQRSRLGLAALLIRQPETLLLDEPTNHLDDDAMEFLEKHLSALAGVVVLSSHDRVFLDAVCTDIVDLDPALGGPTRYGGAYTEYLGHKRAERARWEQRFAEEQEQLKELKESVAVTSRAVAHNRPPRDNDKMGYNFFGGRVQKQVSRRVRNAQLRLDELNRDQVRKPPAPLKFAGTLTGATDEDRLLLSLRDIDVPGRVHIGQLDVPSGARLLVTGGNGAGKSTLLSVLAGNLAPASGSVQRARGVRVGMLEQDVVFADPSLSARQLYVAPEGAPTLSQLGLLAPRDLGRPVGTLSVGQRRRLALALLLADPPHVLLLDEPTNHISLTLAEELFAALETAPGAVVIASHDRWLRRDWQGERLALRPYEG